MSEEMNLRTGSEADAKAVTNDALNRDALDYHRLPTPSKISVLPTKDMTTQRDLALAYSPGGAAECMANKHEPLAQIAPFQQSALLCRANSDIRKPGDPAGQESMRA